MDYFLILERPAFAASGRLARTGSTGSFRRPRIANGPLFQWRSSKPRLTGRLLASHPVCQNSISALFCGLQVYPLQCSSLNHDHDVLAKCEDWQYSSSCTLSFTSKTLFILFVFLGIARLGGPGPGTRMSSLSCPVTVRPGPGSDSDVRVLLVATRLVP